MGRGDEEKREGFEGRGLRGRGGCALGCEVWFGRVVEIGVHTYISTDG